MHHKQKIFLRLVTTIVILISVGNICNAYLQQETQIIENPTYGNLQNRSAPPISFELVREFRSDPENLLRFF